MPRAAEETELRGPSDGAPDAVPHADPRTETTATVATIPVVLPAAAVAVPVIGVCRYLRAADGSHRTVAASREHRCWAVEPPSTIPSNTQQELCLLAAHTACERYQAVQARRAAALASDQIPAVLLEAPRFAPPVSTVPVAVDARAGGREVGTGEDRRWRLPTVLVGVGVALVVVVAFVALFGGGAFLGADPTPTAPAIAGGATDQPDGTPRPTVRPTPIPTTASPTSPTTSSPPATVVPVTPTPVPSFTLRRRYTVKENDTWRTVARKFGLKPRDLRAINPISGQLEPGTVILIPTGPVITD
jgi:LysM repeat protein